MTTARAYNYVRTKDIRGEVCPKCGAQPGFACKRETHKLQNAGTSHLERVQLARDAAMGMSSAIGQVGPAPATGKQIAKLKLCVLRFQARGMKVPPPPSSLNRHTAWVTIDEWLRMLGDEK